MPNQFCQERLNKAKEQVALYDEAITALMTAGVQSYTLDTGASKQIVTKFDLVGLQKTLEHLENKVAVLEARCNGQSTNIARPLW